MTRWMTVLAASAALAACDAEPFVPEGEPSQAVVARVEVSLPAGEMNPGDTATATARAFSANGSVLAFVDFLWQSTDSAVATVQAGAPTETARVTAMDLGVASISARVGGLASTPVVVTVVEPDTADVGGV